MKRILTLALLASAVSLPAMAETGVRSNSSLGASVGGNSVGVNTNTGISADTNRAVTGDNSSRATTRSNIRVEQDASDANDTVDSNNNAAVNNPTRFNSSTSNPSSNTNMGIRSSADSTLSEQSPAATSPNTNVPPGNPEGNTAGTARTFSGAETIQTENLSRAEITQVQEALRTSGYYEGTADGVWGTGSRNALLKFQQRNKLTGNGSLDSNTLNELGVNLNSSTNTSGSVKTNPGAMVDETQGIDGSSTPSSNRDY